MKAYNKLVRDRIPEIIESEGRKYATALMTDDEYKTALCAKLIEEAQEVQTAEPSHVATELADIYEVLDALLTVHHITLSQVKSIQSLRRAERGGFDNRIRLLWVADE